MPKRSRRDFLKKTGIGLTGLAAAPWPAWGAPAKGDFPPHRPLPLEGLHAYADRESVPAGETIRFHVSSSVPYQLGIYKLGLAMDDPAGDILLQEYLPSEPRAQPIHPGSYLHIPTALDRAPSGLTLEAWVRPWKLSAPAALISQCDWPGTDGFGLFLRPDGSAFFFVGAGEAVREEECARTQPQAIKSGLWSHIVAVWDGAQAHIYLNAQAAGQPRSAPALRLGPEPLRIGAAGMRGRADWFLDGDVAMPVLYNRALTPAQIRERFDHKGLRAPTGAAVLGCWKLAEERGNRAADSSSFKRHAEIINHATWMIGGPSFNPEVPRFSGYDPARDATRGHGLRLASDDLYDCRWDPVHKFDVPAAAASGLYVARCRFEVAGEPRLSHVTFIVNRPRRRKKAPLLVLAATNTWRAYSGTPFAASSPKLKQVWGTDGFTNSAGNPPAYNFYRNHAAGQGTYQLGLRLPWPAAGPYILYGGPTDYSHLMRADRFFHVWLEASGYRYDLITDLDLHRNPDQLDGYRAFAINGHSEYWSVPMYRGLQRYLNRGGNVLCLSGNSLFWRVSYSPDSTILECRKVDAPGEQLPPARRGESWHSYDGERGGLLREAGHPGWKLIGLETLGWNNHANPQQFGPYLVDTPDHFLLNQPERSGLKKGDPLGQAPNGGLPRANGHEIDVRLSTLAALQQAPPPAGASLPAEPVGITRLANGMITWRIGGAAFDYFFRPIKPPTDQGGELVYWERPEGGRVFNAGSIGAGWALLADPKFQIVLRNVLAHFGIPKAPGWTSPRAPGTA